MPQGRDSWAYRRGVPGGRGPHGSSAQPVEGGRPGHAVIDERSFYRNLWEERSSASWRRSAQAQLTLLRDYRLQGRGLVPSRSGGRHSRLTLKNLAKAKEVLTVPAPANLPPFYWARLRPQRRLAVTGRFCSWLSYRPSVCRDR